MLTNDCNIYDMAVMEPFLEATYIENNDLHVVLIFTMYDSVWALVHQSEIDGHRLAQSQVG